jgi:hypothetical protein
MAFLFKRKDKKIPRISVRANTQRGIFQLSPSEAVSIARESKDVYPSIEPSPSTSSSRIKVEESHSALSREELIDKVKGIIYGNCIGDAIGLATEFMNKTEANMYYVRPLNFEDCHSDQHRNRWIQGDWTDDSDQMFLILDSLRKYQGSPLNQDENKVPFRSLLPRSCLFLFLLS